MENGNRIGIIGDGQLGRMLTIDAKRLGFEVTVQGPTSNSPTRQVGAEQIIADFKDGNATRELAQRSDYLTVETEHVDTLALFELSANGARVNPSPETLRVVQDNSLKNYYLKMPVFQLPDLEKYPTIKIYWKLLKIFDILFY